MQADWNEGAVSSSNFAGDATVASTLDLLLAEYSGQQEESNPTSATPNGAHLPRVLPVLGSEQGNISSLHRQLLCNGTRRVNMSLNVV